MAMSCTMWGTQRPVPAGKACLASHAEPADLPLRRPAAGCAALLPSRRRSPRGQRAQGQSVRVAAATTEAPASRAASSTSKMLVDLAIESLPLSFGAGVRAVGSCVELGSWNVDEAPELSWTEGNNWRKQLELPSGPHDYKFVIIESEREWWEEGANRRTEVPKPEPEVQQRLELRCQFNNQSATQVKAEAEKPAPAAAPAAAPSSAPESGKLAGQSKPKGRPAKPSQAAATDSGTSTKDPDFKEIQKEKEEDGSITFTFPKGYLFRGGIEDAPPEDEAESTANKGKELDEYETGDLVELKEDPETIKNRQQLEANWKPKYSDSDAAKMDEEYGKTSGSTSEPFDMDKLGEGAQSAGGWTMSDEYDAPNEEYGEDRPDADKDEGGAVDWTKEGAGQTIDPTDAGDFDFDEDA